MSTKEDKIQKLREIAEIDDQGILAVYKFILDLREKVSEIENCSTEVAESLKIALFNEFETLSSNLSSDHKKTLGELKMKIESIKLLKGDKGEDGKNGLDGKDGVDGPDGRNGRDGIDGKDGSPDTGKQIVDKINELPIDDDDYKIGFEHIKDWEDFFGWIKGEFKKVVYVGSGAISASHSPRHEAFTMDGVATFVTLSEGVGAQGNAIIVRYQGQTLDMTTHYTVNGNQVTLVGFVPEASTIISVTYWP